MTNGHDSPEGQIAFHNFRKAADFCKISLLKRPIRQVRQ